MPFPGLSRPGNLNILIPGLSRVCTNPGHWKSETQAIVNYAESPKTPTEINAVAAASVCIANMLTDYPSSPAFCAWYQLTSRDTQGPTGGWWCGVAGEGALTTSATWPAADVITIYQPLSHEAYASNWLPQLLVSVVLMCCVDCVLSSIWLSLRTLRNEQKPHQR